MITERGQLASRVLGMRRISSQPQQIVDLRQPADVVRAQVVAGRHGWVGHLARPQHVWHLQIEAGARPLPDRVQFGDLVPDGPWHRQIAGLVGHLDPVSAVRRRQVPVRQIKAGAVDRHRPRHRVVRQAVGRHHVEIQPADPHRRRLVQGGTRLIPYDFGLRLN